MNTAEVKTKKCSTCHEIKPEPDYYTTGAGYIRARCKACEKERRKKAKPYVKPPTAPTESDTPMCDAANNWLAVPPRHRITDADIQCRENRWMV